MNFKSPIFLPVRGKRFLTHRPRLCRDSILLTCAVIVVALLNGSGCQTTRSTTGEKYMPGPGDEVRFRATVVSIDYLSRYEGRAYIAHFDPLFALTLNIESTDPSNCQIKLGRQVFAVHSPTYVFALIGASMDTRSVLHPELWGKPFDFTIRLSGHGWRSLRAHEGKIRARLRACPPFPPKVDE
jgi:hypothetical protein